MTSRDSQEEHDSELPLGPVAECDFSGSVDAPWYLCARACATFYDAKIYALSFMERYRLKYAVVTTTGINDLPFGVFIDIYTAADVDEWDQELKEQFGIAPVSWVKIPSDRQARCGLMPSERA